MSMPGYNQAEFASGGNRTRYPSPFFDVSQMYVPTTLKEVFKFIHFYASTNSFLGPSIDKMARYPITDSIIEDKNKAVAAFWKDFLVERKNIKSFNMDVNKDLATYGNAIVGIHYPFSRYLKCGNCGNTSAWKSTAKTCREGKVKILCKKCKVEGEAEIKDVPLKDKNKINLLRFDIRNIDIKYNETSGDTIYTYSPSEKLKKQVLSGDADIIETTPKIYLDAISKKKKIRLSTENIYHLKLPTLCTNDMGWGWPRLMSALKDLYYYYTLRKGQEAIVNEYIVPFDILFPNGNGKFDPTSMTDISKWKKQIKEELAQKRKDPAYKAIMPFPVGVERIGGDGKTLMLTSELDFLSKVIVGSVGIPQEFVYGGTMNWSGSSVSLRTLENDFLHNRSQIIDMNKWMIRRIAFFLSKPIPQHYSLGDFKMADDIQRQNLLVQMAQGGRFPWELIYKDLAFDPDMIKSKLTGEAEFFSKLQETQNLAAAKAQAQGSLLMQKYQSRQQLQAAEAQKFQADPSVEVWAEKILALPQMNQEAVLKSFETLVSKGYADKLRAAITGQPSPVAGHFMPTEESSQQEQIDPGQKTPEANSAGGRSGNVVDMRPLPEQRPPRREGGI